MNNQLLRKLIEAQLASISDNELAGHEKTLQEAERSVAAQRRTLNETRKEREELAAMLQELPPAEAE